MSGEWWIEGSERDMCRFCGKRIRGWLGLWRKDVPSPEGLGVVCKGTPPKGLGHRPAKGGMIVFDEKRRK